MQSALALLLGLCSCGCAAEIPAVAAGGERVLIRKGDPPPGYSEIGAISASHGSGCGGFGERGSHEGALAHLRNRAAQMKAEYVRIDVVVEPHFAGFCKVNEYVIRGVAFRRANRAAVESRPAPRGSDQDLFRALGSLVGQRVVLHLRSGEVLAGTVAALSPPDGVRLVLLDQSARSLRIGDIEQVKPAP